jgi:hypothetical protein
MPILISSVKQNVPKFKNCTFTNIKRGCIYVDEGKVELEKCTFTLTKDNSGVMFNRSSWGKITDTSFSGSNALFAIQVIESELVLENSRFQNSFQSILQASESTLTASSLTITNATCKYVFERMTQSKVTITNSKLESSSCGLLSS